MFLLYMAVFDFLVITIVMVLSFQAHSLSSQNLACYPNDLKALKDFMTGLETVIDGWNTDFSSNNCCAWTGITCNSNSSSPSSSSSLGLDNPIQTSRVVKFELPRKKLVGTLFESLGTMDQLRVLNLSQNFLKGTLPVSLFHFRNLQVLDLSFNYFSGPVPATLYLPSIQILDLSRNLLEGYLPVSICDNNSCTIRLLNLAANCFSGNIPIELGSCGGSLKQLYLASNDLTGEVTEGIFRLRKLKFLNLQDNKFSGPMSKGFGSLTNLVRMDISSNGLQESSQMFFITLQC
ncbi:hypothetical protein FEM48_Zijuj09G0180700 [Ziziphus jujuba var. spinosa]|uniref:Leucine-rich repeat-containing N-terminal plant-type domain-containing protein n=1 Tax=Ziziphus jujuba var. spinosa TaxID=714518 RepID=A0A978UUH3_ZIZJJ|nr:hypothetical protein FEM48_Zijuj09G0180700 [Ziziphus jujuba var. spinosa]